MANKRMSRAAAGREYRGFSVVLVESVPAGRKGRYRAAGREFAQLEQVRDYIDSELALAG
jgi:hypothetical protein